MKTLGIIGGVSWHSSAEYYRQLNIKVAHRLGPRHSAKLVLSSIDFADLLSWQRDSDNSRLKSAFRAEVQRLKSAGCEAFVIASHTLSWLGDDLGADVGLKHIGLYDSLISRLRTLGVRRIGLTGTRYTMTDSRYRETYEAAGFEVITPFEPHLTRTATIVYKELVNGVFLPESKIEFIRCFENLVQNKAEAIVLGCTEIGLLIPERQMAFSIASHDGMSTSVPLIDLIETHVNACIDWALSGG